MNRVNHAFSDSSIPAFGWIALVLIASISMSLVLPLPPAFPSLWMAIPLVAPILFIGVWFIQKHLSQPMLGFLALQFIFIWIALDDLISSAVGVHLRLYGLCLLLGILAALLFLRQDWRYLWSFDAFKPLVIFFAGSLLYVLFYGSDFRLADFSAGYSTGLFSTFSDIAAKNIVFLGSLCSFVPFICGLMVFKDIHKSANMQRMLSRLSLIFCLAVGGYCLCSMMNHFQPLAPGHVVILMMTFFGLLTFSQYMVQDSPSKNGLNLPIQHWFKIVIALNLIAILMGMNKTALIAFGLTGLVYILLNRLYRSSQDQDLVNHQSIPHLSNRLGLLLIALAVLWVLLISGVVESLWDRIAYFNHGFSSLSTLSVRMGNWSYFIKDWAESLDSVKLFLGYGLGASRKSIFLISAMRNGAEHNLVQTVHNHYMELFYDYGLFALLYYASTILLVFDNWRCLRSTPAQPVIRKFCILSLCLILSVGIYGLTDGVRIQILMVYYSMLGLVEGLKYALQSTMQVTHEAN